MRMTSPDAPQHPQANLEPQQPAKKTPSKGAKTVGLIAAAAVALCCIGGVVAVFNSSSGKQGVSDGEGPPADRSLESKAMCEEFVKRQLKAPATAKFSDEQAKKVSDVEYTDTGAVDSQNSFGALIRSHFQCDLTIDAAANQWTSKSVTVTDG